MEHSEPKSEGRFHVIPDGDKQCVWMEAGVVAYKICDRNFDCDTCPLDIGLRGFKQTPVADDAGWRKNPVPNLESVSRRGSNHTQMRFSLVSHMVKSYGGDDRYFHPKHTWIQVEAPDRVYIGIDNIAATVLGSIDDISLASSGQRIECGKSCCQIIQRARAFSILSPVSGRIVEINEELNAFPDKLILDSMGRGWLCCIEPDNLEDDLKFCRVGDAVFPWYLKELEWLDSILTKSLERKKKVLGQTMYDGGELSRNLRDLLPPDEYRRLVLSFIGEPNDKTKK